LLTALGKALENKSFEFSDILSSDEKAKAEPTEPISFRLLYAKENHKFEIHMELEWMPVNSVHAKEQ
jgi:hypothetical protein